LLSWKQYGDTSQLMHLVYLMIGLIIGISYNTRIEYRQV
jgi:hypothetical protein